ncbi:MAG: hypothetical protein ACJAZV_002276, partial [Roseivirga sp.]
CLVNLMLRLLTRYLSTDCLAIHKQAFSNPPPYFAEASRRQGGLAINTSSPEAH